MARYLINHALKEKATLEANTRLQTLQKVTEVLHPLNANNIEESVVPICCRQGKNITADSEKCASLPTIIFNYTEEKICLNDKKNS